MPSWKDKLKSPKPQDTSNGGTNALAGGGKALPVATNPPAEPAGGTTVRGPAPEPASAPSKPPPPGGKPGGKLAPEPPVPESEWPESARSEIAQLRERNGKLDAEIARLRPAADLWTTTKADLGRQQHGKEVEIAELARQKMLMEEARSRLEGERSRLLTDAAPWLDAEKAKRLADADREAGDVRKRAAEVESAARQDAERIRAEADSVAAKLREAAERVRAEAEEHAVRVRADGSNARAEATRAAEETLRTADLLAAQARQAGIDEASRVRQEAQAVALDLRRAADDDAGLARDTARKDAATLLEKARMDADETRRKADREAAKLRADVCIEVEKARGAAERERIAAEESARQRIETAEVQAARAARVEADRIEADALAQAEERLGRVAAREGELRARHAEQEECHRLQEDRETTLSLRDRALDARADRSEQRELDVEREAQDQRLRRETLVEAESRLGAAARERLDQALDESQEALAESRRRNRELAEERDRLRDALSAAGGPDIEARQEELDRIRRENGALRARVAEMLPAEEADALRRELAALQGARSEALAAKQQARDMQQAQEQADGRVSRVQQDADREVRKAQAELERQVFEVDRVTNLLAVTEAERVALAATADEARRGKDEVERLRIDRDFAEAQLAEARRLLDDRTRLLKKNAQEKYPVLADLDEKPAVSEFGAPVAPPPLADLVDRVRVTLAKGGRTYDAATLRAWIASLAAHRLIVLKGRSGTGKTSLPVHFADAVGGGRAVVPVQSGWRDRADLLGYFNTFDNRFRAQPFTEAIYKANSPDYWDRPFFVILDECNLSRLEYYFADLLSELELDPTKAGPDKLGSESWQALVGDGRPPHLIRVSETRDGGMVPKYLPEGRFLCLPPNVWIVATANEDESTFEIADKTYDRAGVLQMDSRAVPGKPTGAVLPPLAWGDLTGQFKTAQDAWPKERRDALAKWVGKLDTALQDHFEVGFGNRFANHAELFLPVYEKLGGHVADGADHLLRTRILRKVERTRDPGLRQATADLRGLVEREWPWGGKAERSLLALDKLYGRLS